MPKSLSLKSLILGLIGTAIAVISMTITVRLIWRAWDLLIEWLVKLGFKPEIEYLLGATLFLLAVWLGLIQLKKISLK